MEPLPHLWAADIPLSLRSFSVGLVLAKAEGTGCPLLSAGQEAPAQEKSSREGALGRA